ncbi:MULTISPECIES: LPXTG cell wall anchor domain-containing protein [Exiguobacterium]|uniref:LPXTG cell wall anchor domain-containing protein n=1 Tax=Exiguobacterium TaxID=33986 RepID=UPI00047CA8CF|nr:MULTISPECIES: LPXTG cell wall anchor domain-containing protein [Exiguobacterium]
MRFTTRLLMIMLGSLMLVTGFIHLARLFWEWFHDPTDGGIILRFSGKDGVSGDAFDGKLRMWKDDDLPFLKNDFLDYTFGTGGTVTETGNSVWMWFLIGGLIVLLILTLSMLRKRKGVVSTIDFSRNSVKRGNRTTKAKGFVEPSEIQWTDSAIRNALIQFNLDLPISSRHQSNETVLDWFKRIGVEEVDLSPYWKSRYIDEVVSDEESRRFREALHFKRLEDGKG